MPQTPMGFDALSHNDAGSLQEPVTAADWREWVPATATRNWLLHDTLVDWLDEYGEDVGFVPDDQAPDYDPSTDFRAFLLAKGKEFEAVVLDHLSARTEIVTIAEDTAHVRQFALPAATVQAMHDGVPIINHGVLWNAENRTYGIPDLLVRSDELVRLFPGALTSSEAVIAAPLLTPARWHYRVVDIKFTTLELLVNGELANKDSLRAYKGQLLLYNQALSRIQGYAAPASYLLGRSWSQRRQGQPVRGAGAFERLGRVSHDKETALVSNLDEAVAWIRRLRREGFEWSVFPVPSVPELRPNPGADGGSWTRATREIARTLEDLTCLWRIGHEARRNANERGLYRWTDPRCTATALGAGEGTAPVLQAILDVNRSDGPPVRPARITTAVDEWGEPDPLEFYVDFETVSDLDDDFSRFPARGGHPLIFMIGCGHVEDGEWRFACFIADALTERCERHIINAWLAHMRAVQSRTIHGGEAPRVIHWSKAETVNLVSAYNSAVQRHPEEELAWSTPRWFDFLTEVVRAQPIVVRGAMGFGLKAIAKALWEHGLIQTQWVDGPADGLGAMVAAWAASREAQKRGVPLSSTRLMQGVRQYNEIDCKVMMEIVKYLRDNHLGRPTGAIARRSVPFEDLRQPVADNSSALRLPEGYELRWDEEGLHIHATDYHARPITLRWFQIEQYAKSVGVPLDK